MEPRQSIYDLAYLGTWGNIHRLDEYIGFYDDLLWESLYAVTFAPSYLNRQAYGFVLREGCVSLISKPDEYTPPIDRDLSLGIALLHFTVVAENRGSHLHWQFDTQWDALNLPKGCRQIAVSHL